MSTNEVWACTACNKPRAELKQRKSKVLPGVAVYLCKECIAKKFEPRAFVVLAGREHGYDHISYWIKPQRYHGSPITLVELS